MKFAVLRDNNFLIRNKEDIQSLKCKSSKNCRVVQSGLSAESLAMVEKFYAADDFGQLLMELFFNKPIKINIYIVFNRDNLLYGRVHSLRDLSK